MAFPVDPDVLRYALDELLSLHGGDGSNSCCCADVDGSTGAAVACAASDRNCCSLAVTANSAVEEEAEEFWCPEAAKRFAFRGAPVPMDGDSEWWLDSDDEDDWDDDCNELIDLDHFMATQCDGSDASDTDSDVDLLADDVAAAGCSCDSADNGTAPYAQELDAPAVPHCAAREPSACVEGHDRSLRNSRPRSCGSRDCVGRRRRTNELSASSSTSCDSSSCGESRRSTLSCRGWDELEQSCAALDAQNVQICELDLTRMLLRRKPVRGGEGIAAASQEEVDGDADLLTAEIAPAHLLD
eukprot:TRINITY_DN10958_c0_g1_i1.p1 TRINITY_DN10958_c0_g1~~TRINITY_DN10958_c0_g1_i1.p1  ORF type:complete len:299 (+),score=-6.69 TRINITY_DN10958_c0_g1_i1:174-1070(+)